MGTLNSAQHASTTQDNPGGFTSASRMFNERSASRRAPSSASERAAASPHALMVADCDLETRWGAGAPT
eukprot:31270-Pelagococcus_subviridis.AAC.30